MDCACGPPPEWTLPPPPIPLAEFLENSENSPANQPSTSSSSSTAIEFDQSSVCPASESDRSLFVQLARHSCRTLYDGSRWSDGLTDETDYIESGGPGGPDGPDPDGPTDTDRLLPDILPDWSFDEVLSLQVVKLLLVVLVLLSLTTAICITCLVLRRRRKRYLDSSRAFHLVSSSDDDTYSGSITQPINQHHNLPYANYSRPDSTAQGTMQLPHANGSLLYGTTTTNASPFHRPVSQSYRGSHQRLLTNAHYYQHSTASINQLPANQVVDNRHHQIVDNRSQIVGNQHLSGGHLSPLLYEELIEAGGGTLPPQPTYHHQGGPRTPVGGTGTGGGGGPRRLPPPRARPPPPPVPAHNYSSSGGSAGNASASASDDELELRALGGVTYHQMVGQPSTSDEGVGSNGSSPQQQPVQQAQPDQSGCRYADAAPLLLLDGGGGGRESGYGTGHRGIRPQCNSPPQVQSARIRSIRRGRPSEMAIPNSSLQWIRRTADQQQQPHQPSNNKPPLAVYL